MKKIFILLIGICLLICGCSKTTIKETENKTSMEETQEEETYLIDDFITEFNTSSSIQLINYVEYDAYDKDSGYYRSEFRLNAFKENKSIHANINDNNTSIDIINYNLESTVKGQQIRIYINTDSIDKIKDLFPFVLKLFTENITDEEINSILNKLEDKYGEYETILVDDNKINGYIKKSNSWELYLDK